MVEVALALVLLVSAGLMVKLFCHLTVLDLRHNPENLLVMDVAPPATKHTEQTAVAADYDRTTDRLRALPEVEAAGAHAELPTSELRVEESGPLLLGESLPELCIIRGEYFVAMGTRLIHGRFPEPADVLTPAPRFALVSESVARQYRGRAGRCSWGQLRIRPYNMPTLTVTGVVENLRGWFTSEAEPTVYAANLPQYSTEFVVPTRTDPKTAMSAVRTAVQEVDRTQPIYDLWPVKQRLAELLSGMQYSAVLMGAFAILVVALTVFGTYGVVSQAVARKTHDIGIRMALGAESREVLILVVGKALCLLSCRNHLITAVAERSAQVPQS